MKNREIVTVLGTIAPDRVKFCQFHEHLLLSKGRSYEIHSALFMDDVDLSIQEVERFREAGGNLIIDAQPGGCNRMAEGLQEISARTGVSIICSTGFHKMIFYPENHWIFEATEEELYNFFMQELNQGVSMNCDLTQPEGCGTMKAGIVKCALDTENLSPQYEKLFRSAARAVCDSDRTMMVHIEKGADPRILLEFLFQQSVPASQIVFCHTDRAIVDLEPQLELLKQGIYLEFDTVGRFKYHSDETEIEMIKAILDAGYEDQLLFSLDTTRERLKAYNPDGVGLDYILTSFIEKMKKAGITDEQIDKIARRNPIRALIG